jgi:aryl-alcohol dehydrogenase (NADP+)
MQNHYNLVYREEEREMLPLCRAEGVGVIPWSPLARGFLAGNRTTEAESPGPSSRARSDDFARKLYFAPADFEIVERVKTLAERRGAAPAQVALAWLVRQPGVTSPIVGTSRPEQLDQLVAALDITLDDEECRFLEERYVPHEVLGHS